MKDFGLSVNVHKETHHVWINGEIGGGYIILKHKASTFSADHYAQPPSFIQCGHQMVDKGRPETKMLLDGNWFPAPDNPGKGLTLLLIY